MEKILKIIASFGPAIFIVGYIIGTGSITSMVVSGANYGLTLWWALFLSCFFTYFLVVAISKLTIVSGHTLMYNFRQHFGSFPTVFIILCLLVSIVSSVIGVMGIVGEVVSEWIMEASSGSVSPAQWLVVSIGILLLLILFQTGKYNTFIKGMTLMVAFMAFSFLVTSILVLTAPEVSASTFFPENLIKENQSLLIAGLVGTTMAAVVLVSRSILVQEQGWKLEDLQQERKDAAWSMTLTFLISFAIMVAAAGTLLAQGIKVENAIDMMKALEPLAGKFAMSIFALGIIAAGLSSTFPNLLLFPWVLADYRGKPRNMKLPSVRVIVVIIALTALTIPLLGGKPIWILIASQALSPIVMPLITLFLIILMNRESVMGEYKAKWFMNAALLATLVFNCYMLYVAVMGFLGY